MLLLLGILKRLMKLSILHLQQKNIIQLSMGSSITQAEDTLLTSRMAPTIE